MLGKIKFNDGSIKNIPEIPQKLKEKYKEVLKSGRNGSSNRRPIEENG